MTSPTLESLEIRGFRAFEHLRLDRLGQINLIVGKNNVGKTCVLEALRLYASRSSPTTVTELLSSRDEIGRVYSYPSRVEGEPYTKAIRHLFFDWEAFEEYPHTKEFTIGPASPQKAELSVAAGWYEEQTDPESGRSVWRRALQLPLFAEAKNLRPGLDIRVGDETITSSPLDYFFARGSRPAYWSSRVTELPCSFIPADSLERDAVALLWDKTTLREEEQEILRGLRIIVPEVERLNLVGQDDRKKTTRIPIVKVQGIGDPIPLRSLGEGMNRLFGIILALVNAKDGLLLIDEIDSGLHYTVYRDLWSLIFRIGVRLNVQVFATTHSWDCIEGFQQSALGEGFEKGMLIRLERREGHIVPILFDKERLGIATRQNIEVR